MSTHLEGRPAAPGVALGPVFVVEGGADQAAVAGDDATVRSPEEEATRLTEALRRAEQELRDLAEQVAEAAGPEEAEIFEAHAEFAADPELADQAQAAVAEGATAVTAVTDAFGGFREMLAASPNEYLAARAADLDDVRARVVKILRGESTVVAIPRERSVIAAGELTPSETASLPRELIAGIVTESGSPTSHAAILARALGIPAVVGVQGLLAALDPLAELAIDGRTGEVVIAPDHEERVRIERRADEDARRRKRLELLRDQEARTADGRRVELAANIGDPADLPVAAQAGAEGSGLVRTEFLVIGRRTAPDVDEQEGFYRTVLEAFPGHRVVFRTLDVGADKPLPFVPRDPEPNPALGVRGLRLSLMMPELFRDQLRALLRAYEVTRGDVEARMAIMFPMVSRPDELVAGREVLEEVATEERIGLDDVEVGVMVEVPSAALAARRLARNADFLSMGTNDLMQYLFAADRLVAEAAGLADLCDPDVLRLLGEVVGGAHHENAWVGVCGESASSPVTAAALVGLGVDELSMTPTAIPEIKDMLRQVSIEDLRKAVDAAMESGTPEDARARLELLLPVEE